MTEPASLSTISGLEHELASLVARLPLVSLRLHFIAEEPWGLPRFPGAIFRGAFGAELLRASCGEKEGSCPPCRGPKNCAFGQLFESPRLDQVESLGVTSQLPHPMVLDARVGDDPFRLTVLVELLGSRASVWTGHVVQAALTCVAQGLGKARIRGRVSAVESRDASGCWQPAHEPPTPASIKANPLEGGAVRLRFQTPMRLQSRGEVITPEKITAGLLLRAALRRASLLVRYYGEPGTEPDYGELARTADAVQLRSEELTWFTHERYSARQKDTLPLSGLLGEASLTGPHLSAFWPLLKLTERTAFGKGTVHGLGVVEVEAIGKIGA